MANTYTLIQSVTVGSGGAASIDFTSIPQTYTDLVFRLSVRSTGSANTWSYCMVYLNGSTTSNTMRYLHGIGSTTSSGVESNKPYLILSNANTTASVFTSGELYIPNYSGSTNKSYSFDGVTENNATASYQQLAACLFSNTAAITRITFYAGDGDLNLNQTFAQHSSVSLYGIKNS
jgi:hypothetical protein